MGAAKDVPQTATVAIPASVVANTTRFMIILLKRTRFAQDRTVGASLTADGSTTSL